MLRGNHRALYAAFDRFPSPKGAAIHIDHFARALFSEMKGGLLTVLGDDVLPPYQQEGEIEIVRFCQAIPNFLERTLAFSAMLHSIMEEPGLSELQIAHFRDPWSGMPIVQQRAKLPAKKRFATVYEVNGLPSIELPHRYGMLAQSTIEKIRKLEAACCADADRIIVPSETIADALLRLKLTTEAKLTVIQNGANVPSSPPPKPEGAPEKYILYFGATQLWQGLDCLLRAFSRLADIPELSLVICASHDTAKLKGYRKLAENLGIEQSKIVWMTGLWQAELAGWISHTVISTAPLSDCARNTEQGCAPLKILESMAHAVPVVASDLPCVRELLTDRETGRLVHPDRPAELARTIRIMLEYPEQTRQLGKNAQQVIKERLTWDHATTKLIDIYRSLEAKRDLIA